MKHLIIAIENLDDEIKNVEKKLAADSYAEDDIEHYHGMRRGLTRAYEILTEQLRDAQPDVVNQLNQIRRIINKM